MTVTHNDKSTKPNLENLGIVNDLINISTKKYFLNLEVYFYITFKKKKLRVIFSILDWPIPMIGHAVNSYNKYINDKKTNNDIYIYIYISYGC